MKTSYQREMKRNYLIVDPELSEFPEMIPFEQKMLEQNQIEGILHFQVRQKDEKIRFFYEITSRQPLTRMLEGQSVQAPQIRALIFGIARALDHMEQYLLSEKNVLLDPEYLYLGTRSFLLWNYVWFRGIGKRRRRRSQNCWGIFWNVRIIRIGRLLY